MKRKLAIIMGMLVILLGTPLARSQALHSISIGDTFTYTITEITDSNKINGTEYSTQNGPYNSGDTVDIEVTDIQEKMNNNDFMGGGQMILFSVKENDENLEKGTYLDEWYSFMNLGIILFGFSSFSLIGYPADGFFGAFDPPSDDMMDNSFENNMTLPIFATSNTSFYQEIVDSINDTIDQPSETNYDQVVFSPNLNFDQANNEFTANMEFLISDADTTSNGETIGFTFTFKFNVAIDVARSLVTSMYFQWKTEFNQGDASSLTEMAFSFEEGSGNLNGLPVSSPSLYLVSISLIAISVIMKRKLRS